MDYVQRTVEEDLAILEELFRAGELADNKDFKLIVTDQRDRFYTNNAVELRVDSPGTNHTNNQVIVIDDEDSPIEINSCTRTVSYSNGRVNAIDAYSSQESIEHAQGKTHRNISYGGENVHEQKQVGICDKGKPLASEVCPEGFRHSDLNQGSRQYGEVNSYEYNVHLTDNIQSSSLQTQTNNLGEKQHECKTCGKMFHSQQRLQMHIRVHTGGKRYKCDICQKSFSSMHYLKGHNNVHIGGKQFECSICKKRFALPATLKTHMYIHTG